MQSGITKSAIRDATTWSGAIGTMRSIPQAIERGSPAVPQTPDQHQRLVGDMIALEAKGRVQTMRIFRSLISFAIVFFISGENAYSSDRPAGVPDEARYVKVDRITDGDTIVLMDRTRVRLHGINGLCWLCLVVREIRARQQGA